jgi:hypothetical protein
VLARAACRGTCGSALIAVHWFEYKRGSLVVIRREARSTCDDGRVSILALAVTGLLIAAVIYSVNKRHRRTHAVTVMSRLRRNGTYVVKVGPFTNVWTPEPPVAPHFPMGFTQMPGRGTLTYSTEREPETVRLHWQPKNGAPHDWIGPAPIVASANFRRRNRRSVAVAVGVSVVLVAMGAAIGAADGSTKSGLVGGVALAYVAGICIWAGGLSRAFRGALTDRKTAQQSHTPKAD